MATQGAVEVFRSGGGGGGSPYLEHYLRPETEEKQAQFRDALAMAEEQRAQKSFDIQSAREMRMQNMQDIRDRKELRQMDQQEALDSAQEKISSALGNPADMGFQERYEKIMGDPDIHRARATTAGREAIDSMLNEQKESHNHYIDSWAKIGAGYGWNGDPRTLPKNKDGTVDWETSLQTVFKPAQEAARQQKQMQDQQDSQKSMQQKIGLREQAFRSGMVAGEMSPTGDIKYKYEKGVKPKPIQLNALSMEEQMAVLNRLKQEIDPNLPKEQQKKLLMDLTKKSGYQY